MSNQEAIALLRNLEDALDSYCELNEEGKTAFRMAIEALSCSENPNNSDCISRQAAIDALAKFIPYAIYDESTQSYTNGLTDAYYLILQLPSAQPEEDCDTCKHGYFGDTCCNNCKVSFPSHYERRTDE